MTSKYELNEMELEQVSGGRRPPSNGKGAQNIHDGLRTLGKNLKEIFIDPPLKKILPSTPAPVTPLDTIVDFTK